MPALQTPKPTLDSKAIDFSLPSTDGKHLSLADCRGDKGLLVMFICNHCPYVRSIVRDLVDDCKQLQQQGVGVVAICSNDDQAYPEDAFDNMALFAQEKQFTFPYLHDQSQQVAKAYDAVCTPDFFGYNAALKLQYRGRFDARGSSAGNTGDRELLKAMLEVAATGKGPQQQLPSIGCSIKWKA